MQLCVAVHTLTVHTIMSDQSYLEGLQGFNKRLLVGLLILLDVHALQIDVHAPAKELGLQEWLCVLPKEQRLPILGRRRTASCGGPCTALIDVGRTAQREQRDAF